MRFLKQQELKHQGGWRRLSTRLLSLIAALTVSGASAITPPSIPDLALDQKSELRRAARRDIGQFKHRKRAQAAGAYLDAATSTIADELELYPRSVRQMSELMPLVEEMGERFQIGPHLVMAVIHTESAFNPRARSAADAYGLMQIVPVFAGRSALKFLTGEDKRPEAEQLFDAKLNVELGTAYIAILRERHFSRVADPKVRNLAVIAAYNWGPTRVSRMLRNAGGKMTVRRFLALLDQKAPRETIDYVERVTRRARHYYAWFKNARKNDLAQSISARRSALASRKSSDLSRLKFPVAIR